MAILDVNTHADARKGSQHLAFGVVLMQAERLAPN